MIMKQYGFYMWENVWDEEHNYFDNQRVHKSVGGLSVRWLRNLCIILLVIVMAVWVGVFTYLSSVVWSSNDILCLIGVVLGLAPGGALVFIIPLIDDRVDSIQTALEDEAVKPAKARLEAQSEKLYNQMMEYRQDPKNKFKEYARKYVEQYITLEQLCNEIRGLSTEQQLEVFEHINIYEKHRKSLKL